MDPGPRLHRGHRRPYRDHASGRIRGIIFIAQDYFSGGDSSRPADGDFIGLEVQADVAHEVYRQVRDRVSDGMLIDGSRRCPARCSLASASRSAASSR